MDVIAIGHAGSGSSFIAAHVSPRRITYYCNSGAESFDVPLYYQQITKRVEGPRIDIDLHYHIQAALELLFGFSGSKATYMSVRGSGGDGGIYPFCSFRIGRQRYDTTAFEFPPLWCPDFATDFSAQYLIPSNLPRSPDGEYYFAYLVWKLRTHQQLSGLDEKLFLILFMDQTPEQAKEIHDYVQGPETQIPESCQRYMRMSGEEQRSFGNGVYELPANVLDALIDGGAFTRQWADWVGLVPVAGPSSSTGDDGLRPVVPLPKPIVCPLPATGSCQDIEGLRLSFPLVFGPDDSGSQQAGPNVYFLNELPGACQTTQSETPPQFPMGALIPEHHHFEGIPNSAASNSQTMLLNEAALDVLGRADPDYLGSLWDDLGPAGRSSMEDTLKALEDVDISEINSNTITEPRALLSVFESIKRRQQKRLEGGLGKALSSTTTSTAAATAAPPTGPWGKPGAGDSDLGIKLLVTKKGHAYIKGERYDEMMKQFQDEESLIQAIDKGIVGLQNAGCFAGGTNSFILPVSSLAPDAPRASAQRPPPPPKQPTAPSSGRPPRAEPTGYEQQGDWSHQPAGLHSAPPGSPKGPATASPPLCQGREQEGEILANALRELNALIPPPTTVSRNEGPPPASARIIAAKRIRPLGAGAGTGPEYIQPEFATFNRQRAPMTSFGTYGIDPVTGQQYFSTGEWCVSEASRMWKRILRQRGVTGKATEDIPYSGWLLVTPPKGPYVPSPSAVPPFPFPLPSYLLADPVDWTRTWLRRLSSLRAWQSCTHKKFSRRVLVLAERGAQEKRDQAPADVSTVGAPDEEGVGAASESQSLSQEGP